MDKLAEKLEEFGSISMSAPLLSPPDPAFGFGLERDSSTYFTEAKSEIEGAAATLDQVLQSNSFSASAQYDPTKVGEFVEQLRVYRADATRRETMQNVLDHDARAQYQAAKQAADKETDPEKKAELLKQARADFAENMKPAATPAPLPAAGDLPAAPSPLPTPDNPFVDAGKFAAAGALLGDTKPVLSNRAALVTAAGDKAVETIFNVLGNPEAAQKFKGRRILFGAATVSVDPGWRTREDFAANLSVRLSYTYEKARREVVEALVQDDDLDARIRARLAIDYQIACASPAGTRTAVSSDPIPYGWACPASDAHQEEGGYKCKDTTGYSNPVVTAVSPLTDVQTLDLASASRRMDQLAIALSFALRSAGQGGQAEDMETYIHSLQKDVRTRTAAVAANSYSAGGGLFGYQVGPKLRAIGDAASESGPSNVLDRQSFPILVVLGIDDADGRPLLQWENGFLQVYEPVVHFTQTARWMPLSLPWYTCLGIPGPRWSEQSRLEESYALNEAAERSKAWSDPERCPPGREGCPSDEERNTRNRTLGLAAERTWVLKSLGFGSSLNLTLPVNFLVPEHAACPPPLSDSASKRSQRHRATQRR